VAVSSRFRHSERYLDERTRRMLAAAEAKAAGRGGISRVAQVPGVSENTIRAGLKELITSAPTTGMEEVPRRIRRPGGGRKKADSKDPDLLPVLERLVSPATRGDPMSPLRWTSKSTQKLAVELTAQGHGVSARTVARLLGVLG
jgi:hypothetical protein